jgi:hypothetical protein
MNTTLNYDVMIMVSGGTIQNVRARDENLRVRIIDFDEREEKAKEKEIEYRQFCDSKDFHNV